MQSLAMPVVCLRACAAVLRFHSPKHEGSDHADSLDGHYKRVLMCRISKADARCERSARGRP